jgi:hypothetical protein
MVRTGYGSFPIGFVASASRGIVVQGNADPGSAIEVFGPMKRLASRATVHALARLASVAAFGTVVLGHRWF